MNSWLGPGVEDSSSSFVDSDVSAVNDVEGTSSPESEDGECSKGESLYKFRHNDYQDML